MAEEAAFRRVLAAEGVSNFGSMLSRLAIPWLAVLVLAATPVQIAALLMAEMLVVALATLWLGNAVEKRGKRAVMLLCDGVRALLLALLVLLAWAGALGMGLLVVVATLAALATAAFEMARSAWMAQRLSQSALTASNARLSMVSSLSETAAFAAGGWLFQGLGALFALAVNTLSYAASALCLRGVPEAPAIVGTTTAVPAGDSGWQRLRQQSREAGDGLRAVWRSAVLRPLALIQAWLAFGFGLTGTAYAIYTARDLALPPAWLGMVAALGALGAIAGAWLAPRLGQRFGPGRSIAIGLALFALGAVCIPLAQGAGVAALLLLAAHQVIGDGGHTLHEVHDRTLRQTAVGPQLLARADAGIRSVGAWAALAGTAAGGLLGEAFGARTVLFSAAGCAAAAALLAALTLARQRQRGPPSTSPST